LRSAQTTRKDEGGGGKRKEGRKEGREEKLISIMRHLNVIEKYKKKTTNDPKIITT
jgi:hypothetical protein